MLEIPLTFLQHKEWDLQLEHNAGNRFFGNLLPFLIVILIILSHEELQNKTVFAVQLTVFVPYLNFQPIFN